MNGAVLDTGALIAFERGNRDVAVIVAEAKRAGVRLTVPSGCVAQAWRHPSRQARMAMLLRQSLVNVAPLDHKTARQVGLLLAATETTDVVDGHVAVCASRLNQMIITSDPGDLQRLAPGLSIHAI